MTQNVSSIRQAYFVPRSQVWEGSRGRQRGRVHLIVDGKVVCGRLRGWYERPPHSDEKWCKRCAEGAERRGIPWPQ